MARGQIGSRIKIPRKCTYPAFLIGGGFQVRSRMDGLSSFGH